MVHKLAGLTKASAGMTNSKRLPTTNYSRYHEIARPERSEKMGPVMTQWATSMTRLPSPSVQSRTLHPTAHTSHRTMPYIHGTLAITFSVEQNAVSSKSNSSACIGWHTIRGVGTASNTYV